MLENRNIENIQYMALRQYFSKNGHGLSIYLFIELLYSYFSGYMSLYSHIYCSKC